MHREPTKNVYNGSFIHTLNQESNEREHSNNKTMVKQKILTKVSSLVQKQQDEKSNIALPSPPSPWPHVACIEHPSPISILCPHCSFSISSSKGEKVREGKG